MQKINSNSCQKRLLSIDYGTKRVGLATFDGEYDPCPCPYGVIAYLGDEQLVKSVVKLVEEQEIAWVVIGIPKLVDGKETSMSRRVENFGHRLKNNLSKLKVDVFFQDETLSSFEAEDRMRNSPLYNFKVDKNKIDQLSAVIILEDFLRNYSLK
ncbi:MAG: Holliday junction resolvase RuvX [Oligoflexia bacterium]|nr:Holliday junction resolvase RuvX [Oligoflexia bacterium]MBF0366369.1 Holliday junction resolvase RuvX [Oligoflexia bacterium]